MQISNPISETTNDKLCSFPFYSIFTKTHYNYCSKDLSNGRVRDALGVSPTADIAWCIDSDNNYAICKPKASGTWSGYSRRRCSMPCGGGVVQFERVCLYEPCLGEAYVEDDGKVCNQHKCRDHKIKAKGKYQIDTISPFDSF